MQLYIITVANQPGVMTGAYGIEPERNATIKHG
jgi:hypothetical protein